MCMKKTESIPATELPKLLEYDPNTGLLFWKRRPSDMFPSIRAANSWNGRYAGKETASFVNPWGYRDISIMRVKHASHRVAWAIYHGEWPDGEIDHINRDPSDNRIDNLRVVSSLENSRNKGNYKNNKSGHRGVTWHKGTGKWMGQIKVDKKNIHLGLFERPEDAGRAYRDAAKRYFGRA